MKDNTKPPIWCFLEEKQKKRGGGKEARRYFKQWALESEHCVYSLSNGVKCQYQQEIHSKRFLLDTYFTLSLTHTLANAIYLGFPPLPSSVLDTFHLSGNPAFILAAACKSQIQEVVGQPAQVPSPGILLPTPFLQHWLELEEFWPHLKTKSIGWDSQSANLSTTSLCYRPSPGCCRNLF